jgi:hypothetical protein
MQIWPSYCMIIKENVLSLSTSVNTDIFRMLDCYKHKAWRRLGQLSVGLLNILASIEALFERQGCWVDACGSYHITLTLITNRAPGSQTYYPCIKKPANTLGTRVIDARHWTHVLLESKITHKNPLIFIKHRSVGG